ncbi:MAG: AI-2E family transporter [Ruminococcaceae bacterium]|nr:AI-2E family transporter [Oscillospiraceae bacterium]
MKISFNKKYSTIALYAVAIILFAVICVKAIIVSPVGLSSVWGGIRQIIKTLFYALIVAYIMSPVMNFFHHKVFRFIQKKREFSVIRKLVALFFTFLVFFSVITAFVWFAIPQVVANIENLGTVLTGYYESIDTYISTLKENSPVFEKLYSTVIKNDGNLGDLLNEALAALLAAVTSASDYIITFISNFVNEVKTIFMGVFLSIYFVYYKEMLVSQVSRFFRAFMRPKTFAYASHIVDDIDIKFAKFLRGKAFDSTIVGIVLYIVYKIVGMPYAEILALVGGIMNMVPTFGPIIASFVCGFILLLTAPKMLFAYIIIVCVVGLTDSQIIEPKMLGDSLGLKPVWITLSVIIMSALFGLFGMFFGVPIFAVIYTLVKEAVDNRTAQREAREPIAEVESTDTVPEETATESAPEENANDSAAEDTPTDDQK